MCPGQPRDGAGEERPGGGGGGGGGATLVCPGQPRDGAGEERPGGEGRGGWFSLHHYHDWMMRGEVGLLICPQGALKERGGGWKQEERQVIETSCHLSLWFYLSCMIFLGWQAWLAIKIEGVAGYKDGEACLASCSCVYPQHCQRFKPAAKLC